MQIYQVGGAVRDQLLGLPVVDRDWVVVGATADDMLALGYRPVGRDFPVFLHPKTHEEYALARTERKTAAGHQGFVCHASADVTLEEDLLRRDLTINAMAMNDAGNIIDPYGGQADLEAKALRHVSEAFSEDPLRVLRVARFQARFGPLGFKVDGATLALITQMAEQNELASLSAERVWQELLKALSSEAPAEFFWTLKQAQALNPWFLDLTEADMKRLEIGASQLRDPTGRYALLTCMGELTHFEKQLKVPKAFIQLRGICSALMAGARAHQLDEAKNVVELLAHLGVLRNSETLTVFNQALQVCEVVCEIEQVSVVPTAFLARAAQTALKLTAADLPNRDQLQGVEIGQALLAMRIEKVRALQVSD